MKPVITLIHPKLPHVDDPSRVDPIYFPRPHSIFYILGALERTGEYAVSLIDLQLPRYHHRSLEEIFGGSPATIFGITATTDTRFEAIRIAKFLKGRYPDSRIVAGGVHFTHTALDALQQVPELDAVVVGEGDETIVELARAIVNHESLEGIGGILYRDEQGAIRQNMMGVFIENIDHIATCFNFSRADYPENLVDIAGNQWPAITMITSRGCPYHCAFCSNTEKRYRAKSAKLVVDEVEFAMRKFEVPAIKFLDATLTTNAAHLRRFCAELVERKIDLKWSCASRANTPVRLLEVMQQAGCKAITVGVETGSQRILDRITKGITVEKAIAYFERCKELGIHATCFFIISHPEETREDVFATFRMMEKLEQLGFAYSIQPCAIFPGTGLEQTARESGLLPPEFSWNAPYYSPLSAELGENPAVPPFLDRLSVAEIKELLGIYRAMRDLNDSRAYYEQLWKGGIGGLATRLFRAVREGRQLRLGNHLRMLRGMLWQRTISGKAG